MPVQTPWTRLPTDRWTAAQPFNKSPHPPEPNSHSPSHLVHTLPSYFFRIHFRTVLPNTTTSSRQHPSIRVFLSKLGMCVCVCVCVCVYIYIYTHIYVFPPMRPPCPVHLVLLDSIILIILRWKQKSWNPVFRTFAASCYFLPLGPCSWLTTLLSNTFNLKFRGPCTVIYRVAQKKCIHSLLINIFGINLNEISGHFEHLHWIQNSRTSLISILLLYRYSSYDYRVIFFMSKCVHIFLGHSVFL